MALRLMLGGGNHEARARCASRHLMLAPTAHALGGDAPKQRRNVNDGCESCQRKPDAQRWDGRAAMTALQRRRRQSGASLDITLMRCTRQPPITGAGAGAGAPLHGAILGRAAARPSDARSVCKGRSRHHDTAAHGGSSGVFSRGNTATHSVSRDVATRRRHSPWRRAPCSSRASLLILELRGLRLERTANAAARPKAPKDQRGSRQADE